MTDLFADEFPAPDARTLCEGAVLLTGFARSREQALLDAIEQVAAAAPFRQMQTPGGHTMSVAMTNCGDQGWVTDRRGYRYQTTDPEQASAWPPMPPVFRQLALEAASEAGFRGFDPDVCLINRYQPGARMGLHQDRDERDFSQPIVSVSLGTPVTFQLGGLERRDKPVRVPLQHGDVVVWGGPARLRYHGVLTLKRGTHPLTGDLRYNLTFRRAT